MSSFLYGLGRSAYRHRLRVVLAWLAALVVLGGVSAVVSKGFDENFSLPGTESQTALDSLNRTFPQAGGTTAQVVVVPRDGQSARSAAVKKAIDASAGRFRDVSQVDSVTGPFDKYAKGLVAADRSAAIINVTFAVPQVDITPETFDALQQQGAELQAALPGSRVSVGGDAFSGGTPGVSLSEGVGVLVALIVLWLTLGSLRAAGMPLLTALLGVGLTVALIFGATGFATVSSTTPLLALMLGLAVGIDYALFITSRHRDQLRAGMDPEESVARAVATAGSAVVFAGMTVMIALVGLSVAGIPFLSIMGVAAAVGVAIAVLIALTLLPALLGFFGEKLRPKPQPQPQPQDESAPQTPTRAARSPRAPRVGPPRIPLGRRWVQLVTKVPVLTVVLVIVALGAMTYPAKDLRIALPSNGTATPGTPARVTYDLVAQHFGPGFNGPLIVTATIVGSDDPLGVMDGMADQLRALPGVASVPLTTPNEDADTGIIQVIPEGAPDSEETKQLVRDIRALEPHFSDQYGVATAVTGFTAVGIDISDRLGAALVPFGLLVVGLSLVLLTMVFRSIAVPVKATVGYLLSVGAAFGVTAMVFEYGWFGSLFNVDQTAPVISFLPILLMGILFGLAMDYEVFLVSRMREEYVHGVRSLSEGGRPPTPPAGVPFAGARETHVSEGGRPPTPPAGVPFAGARETHVSEGGRPPTPPAGVPLAGARETHVSEGGRPPTPPAGVPLAGARETHVSEGGRPPTPPAGVPLAGARETHAGVARAAVEDGFVASARVVVAAAVIMLSVFGAFVPEGDGAIKTIGFGLAVGVFVDAFIVRMTLVPAVLTLLGTRAWWLPRWIDQRLPSFDVEGEGLAHQVELAQWPSPDDRHLVVAEGLRVGDFDDVAPSVLPGEVLVVEGPSAVGSTALLLMLAGRMRLPEPAQGRTVRAKTAGFVLPEQAGRVRRRTAYVDCSASTDLPRELAGLARSKPAVLFLDRLDALTDPDARAALARTFDALAADGTAAAVVAVADRAALETLLRGPSRVLDLRRRHALAQA